MSEMTKESIYIAYKDKVTRYISAKISNRDEVEDLVSTVFLKVMEKFDTFDSSKASISTWIYTITGNTVIDYFRTRKVTTEIPEENGEDGLMPSALVMNEGLDANILREESLEELANALEQIPLRERDLIILHYYSNLTLKEVAEKMQMSYANAKIVHKKALEHMRAYL